MFKRNKKYVEEMENNEIEQEDEKTEIENRTETKRDKILFHAIETGTGIEIGTSKKITMDWLRQCAKRAELYNSAMIEVYDNHDNMIGEYETAELLKKPEVEPVAVPEPETDLETIAEPEPQPMTPGGMSVSGTQITIDIQPLINQMIQERFFNQKSWIDEILESKEKLEMLKQIFGAESNPDIQKWAFVSEYVVNPILSRVDKFLFTDMDPVELPEDLSDNNTGTAPDEINGVDENMEKKQKLKDAFKYVPMLAGLVQKDMDPVDTINRFWSFVPRGYKNDIVDVIKNGGADYIKNMWNDNKETFLSEYRELKQMHEQGQKEVLPYLKNMVRLKNAIDILLSPAGLKWLNTAFKTISELEEL